MTAGSVKAKAAAKATVASENVAPRTETMPDKLVGVQVATPSFLPPGGLRALHSRTWLVVLVRGSGVWGACEVCVYKALSCIYAKGEEARPRPLALAQRRMRKREEWSLVMSHGPGKRNLCGNGRTRSVWPHNR